MIYLDHNATTPVADEVLEAMLPYFSEHFGNPSSIHRSGREAQTALEKARSQIASAINARESEIFFVSGGTEANNLALQGVTGHHAHRGKHIIISAVEHPSVLQTCQMLSRNGFEVTMLPVDSTGMVSSADVAASIRKETIMVSIMLANNEVGTINPIDEIGEVTRRHGIIFHSDAVQAFGKQALDVNELQVDMLSLSAHKIYGPKGCGALYIRKGTEYTPLQWGGQQERGKRAGTENLPAIVGFGHAALLLLETGTSTNAEIEVLRNSLENDIKSRIENVQVNGHPNQRLPNTLNMSFRGCTSEMLLMGLNMKGIAVSSGAACSSGRVEPSHVLTAMGQTREIANSSIRISLGKDNTNSDISTTAEALITLVKTLRN